MYATGSTLAADEDVTLHAFNLPPGNVCLFIASANQGFNPTPGTSCGNLCLMGPDVARFKFDAQVVNDLGKCSLTIDPWVVLTNPPQPILAGQTWNFQTWHRDADALPDCNNKLHRGRRDHVPVGARPLSRAALHGGRDRIRASRAPGARLAVRGHSDCAGRSRSSRRLKKSTSRSGRSPSSMKKDRALPVGPVGASRACCGTDRRGSSGRSPPPRRRTAACRRGTGPGPGSCAPRRSTGRWRGS